MFVGWGGGVGVGGGVVVVSFLFDIVYFKKCIMLECGIKWVCEYCMYENWLFVIKCIMCCV